MSSNSNVSELPTQSYNALKKFKQGDRLPADTIIDLYKLAKSEENAELMRLVKTFRVNEIMKKSELKSVIKEIIKGIFKEMTATGAVSPVSIPKAFQKKTKEEIDEMTTTGDVSGYNVPSAFSRKGGSESGVRGSQKLGYELTPMGKKEMNRHADTL